MRFLRTDECVDWCRRHGYQLPDELGLHPHEGFARYDFAIPADAGHRVALCRLLWNLGDAGQVTERLVWIKDWSVWPSSEHMPLFTRWRAAFGETRTLGDASGQLIEPGDDDDGLSLLIMACLFLWDCWMYLESGVIVAISNEECGFLPLARDAN